MSRVTTLSVDDMQLAVATDHTWAVLYSDRGGRQPKTLKRASTTSSRSSIDAAVRKLMRAPMPRRVYVFHVASGQLVSRLSNERVG